MLITFDFQKYICIYLEKAKNSFSVFDINTQKPEIDLEISAFRGRQGNFYSDLNEPL